MYLCTRGFQSLELVDLVRAVSKLLQGTAQLTLVLRADLGPTQSLVHGRRTTDKDLNVLLLGLRHDGLQELLGDVALTAGPLGWGVVEEVEGLEALGVGVLQLFPLLLQKDVLLTDVTEHQGDLGLVLGVLEDVAGELVHGSDTSATGKQNNVVVLVSLPRVLGKGTLEVQTLTNVHAVQVLGHGAVRIALDHELEVTRNVCSIVSECSRL